MSDTQDLRDRADLGDALVIIPALNEEGTLGTVVAALRDLKPALTVLVIDDGSSDGTAAVAREHGARVVSHPFNLGYGAALQTGYKYAVASGYDFVVQMDADGQHAASDVARLLAPLHLGQGDVVLGSRFTARGEYQMSAFRSFGRTCMQLLLRACGGPRVEDPTSGFQGYNRRVLEFCCGEFYPSDFPDIDVLLALHLRGFRILEVPVHMSPNPPSRISMHGGMREVYYAYKMMLATLRSALTPRPTVRRPREEK